MKKLLGLSLAVMTGCMMNLAAHADVLSDHYRTLDLKATYTNVPDGNSKNVYYLFPFHLPDNLPGKPVFKGIRGTYGVHATPHYDASNQEDTFAETLFGVTYSENACPKPGEVIDANAYQSKYNPIGLGGQIVKTSIGGVDQTSKVGGINPYDTPLNIGKDGCILTLFNVVEEHNQEYTSKVDLQLLYSFEPISIGLDAEFHMDFSNRTKPTLNAYSIVPVTSDPNATGIFMRPGTIVTLGGNVAASAKYIQTKGHWFFHYITAIYQHNSCKKAFEHYHLSKFFTNSPSGTDSSHNPSSIFWPSSKIVAYSTVMGTDRESFTTQVTAHDMPLHVEDGDCVVQMAIPYGDNTTVDGSGANLEFQVFANYIPD